MSTGPTHLTIVGIVHDVSEVSGSSNPEGRLGEAFTTLDAMNQLRGLPAGSAERLWLQAKDRSPRALSDLQREIDHTLSQLGFQDGSTLILGEDLSGISGADQFIVIIFNIAAILVAGIGLLILAHALATFVVERRLEIGILRSLGATSWRVGAIFGFEGLVLAILAWGGGMILGLLAALGILDILGAFVGPMDLSFDPMILLLTFLFMMSIACLASIAPVINAAHVRVRDILHYE
jgi:putative ABC transport system permease protein